MDDKEPEIRLKISKFKEILLYSWHLLPPEKQAELVQIGVYPQH